ncbi:SAVMC3_10250 family protein [Bradyrhizobium sp. 141]|uniref:DUF7019 family protein n=1 Tax=Bradyrhizobium sp. 141 TaxID=2782617 RepID=UPI001FF7C69F|nr:SAVMC3_10250 family protein [Bradyrhizobium sp. 141]MCK1721316.1 hypothetical protein [Bradyrhizobium sp. 141]
MKYYLYISETKVGMLHSQIGVTRFSKIKAAIKLKMPFFEASVDSDAGKKSIYAKAEEIRNQILAGGECGTIAAPKAYVDDTANLSFGRVADYAAEIAFFGGIVGSKSVALIGSSSSLIGAAKQDANHTIDYYEIKFMAETSDEINPTFPAKRERYENFEKQMEASVVDALKRVRNRPRPVAFVAKVILASPNFLVASPIFVREA